MYSPNSVFKSAACWLNTLAQSGLCALNIIGSSLMSGRLTRKPLVGNERIPIVVNPALNCRFENRSDCSIAESRGNDSELEENLRG